MFYIDGKIDIKSGHDVESLFDQSLKIRSRWGCRDDNDLARNVKSALALVQPFDPFADRFRYPTDKGGKTYVGIALDLDELFKATGSSRRGARVPPWNSNEIFDGSLSAL